MELGHADRLGRALWPALAFIAVGPAVLAYRCWGGACSGQGLRWRVLRQPHALFAAVLSAAFLGETPHLFHGVAFAFIVGGIVVSSRR